MKRQATRISHHARRGVTAVEMAIVILVFLTIVLGVIELGLAIFRNNIVMNSAHQAARQVIVHGSRSDSPWGPAAYSATADGAGDIESGIRSSLVGLDPADTTIDISWLDGDNDPDSRVEVIITSQHQPFLTWVFGSGAWTLQGVSTMPIAH